MAEGAPLLREYSPKANRGFESLRLRQSLGVELSPDRWIPPKAPHAAGFRASGLWLRVAKMNACWEGWLDGLAVPARTTVQAALATEDLLVEFTVTAAC